MKIIDCAKKGNIVRFYLGDDDCNDYWGDDWNDRPYEHNASEVYDRYVTGYADVAMDFAGGLCEPSDDWHYGGNSPYRKEDFKKSMAPCLLVIAPRFAESYWDFAEYSRIVADKNVMKVYYNQPYDKEFKADLVINGCTIIDERLDIERNTDE